MSEEFQFIVQIHRRPDKVHEIFDWEEKCFGGEHMFHYHWVGNSQIFRSPDNPWPLRVTTSDEKVMTLFILKFGDKHVR